MPRNKNKPAKKKKRQKLPTHSVCLMEKAAPYGPLTVQVQAADYPAAVRVALAQNPGYVPHPRSDDNQLHGFHGTTEEMRHAAFGPKRR